MCFSMHKLLTNRNILYKYLVEMNYLGTQPASFFFLTKLSKKTFNIKRNNKKEKRAFQKVNTISCEKGVSSHICFIAHQNLQRRFEKLKDKRMYQLRTIYCNEYIFYQNKRRVLKFCSLGPFRTIAASANGEKVLQYQIQFQIEENRHVNRLIVFFITLLCAHESVLLTLKRTRRAEDSRSRSQNANVFR